MREDFCRSVKQALADGIPVHVIAWDDAKKFNLIAIPGFTETDRNGDWVYPKSALDIS